MWLPRQHERYLTAFHVSAQVKATASAPRHPHVTTFFPLDSTLISMTIEDIYHGGQKQEAKI
jgi:hypothetical protein